MLTIPMCHPQAQGETTPGYAARVLRFGLRYGAEYLTQDQCTHADHAAMAQIAALPAGTPAQPMDADQGRTYALLVRFRRQLAEDQERRHAARLQDARTLAAYAAEQEADDIETTPDPTGVTDTDQARALRLLRAALILVMGPQSGGGNEGSRLTPPPLTPQGPLTPSNAADPYEPVRLSGGRF